jgi:uncharacterized protein YjbJ (UPF0337 family)
MKKFLLMFAAVAAIAFVGCKTETKPEAEVVEEAPVAEYTVDGVTADLMNCADEASAVSLLDGIKAKAQDLLNAGDQAGYFNIINILKTVWENNKEAILAKIPTLAEKMTDYIDVPENLKAGFADFVAKQAAEKVGQAVDGAKDAANAAADAAANKAGEAVDAAKDAAGNAVDAAKEKGAEAAQAVADELKK